MADREQTSARPLEVSSVLDTIGGRASRSARGAFDFEHPGPAFAGDEEVSGGGVAGDAVEFLGAVWLGQLAAQGGEVEPARDAAVGRVDARDAVAGVDVGEDVAVGVLEFVEFLDRASLVAHLEGFLDGEGVRVEELQRA